MRNKFKGMMLLAVAAMGVVGCSDKLTDEIVNPSPEEVGGETGYISFRIKSADTGGMTRAWNDKDGDTSNGEDNDYAEGAGASGKFAGEDDVVNNVQANRVFFFDKDGKYHSSALLTLDKKEDGTHDSDHSNTYAESVYSTTVKRVSERGAEDWPAQCLIVLNGRPSRLNALTVKAQEDEDFNLLKFLKWENTDYTDADEEGETLGLYKFDNKYYFTMTNSVYLDDSDDSKKADDVDGDQSAGSKIIDATQIDKGKMKNTRDAAADDPITVYVERIMSKVGVSFTGYDGANGKEGQFGDDDSPLGFLYTFTDKAEQNATWIGDAEEGKQKQVVLKGLITNWTINAVEYKTKLFKTIDENWTEPTGDTQNATDIFEGWNDMKHHRSYWAIDPHYEFGDGTAYPTQFRTSFDKFTVRPYQSEWEYGKSEAEEGGNDIFNSTYKWALDYKSFDAVVNKRAYKYCLENTFGLTPNDEEGYKHMIMGSHVLVQARLLTEDEAKGLNDASSLEDLNIGDKYYFSDSYYDENTYIGSRVTRINQTLGENYVGELTFDNLKMFDDEDNQEGNYTLGNIAGGLWIKTKTDEGDEIYKKIVAVVNEDNKDNEIAATEVFNIAPAYIKKGDGKVTIALKSSVETMEDDEDAEYAYNVKSVIENGGKVNLYYVKENIVDEDGQPNEKVLDKDGKPTDEDNIVQFTRNQLVSLIYQVAGTADCFKEGRMYYTIPIQHHLAGTGADGNYEYKYTGLNTADYGVVRNHWYKFKVNQILKPGIPVHDPTQPIVPNYDDEDRFLGLEIIILPWHVVDNGNVTLGQ